MDPDAQLQTVAPPLAGSVPRRSRLRWLRVPFRRGRGGAPTELPEKTLSGHLIELRNRLVISALSLLPGTILGFVFAGSIIKVLVAPLPKGHLVAFGLTEPFMIDLQIAVTTGAIVAMPVIL